MTDTIVTADRLREALRRAETFANEYEFDSDEGCHTPNDVERMLMLDMLNGLFDDEEFVEALALRTPSEGVDWTELTERLAAAQTDTDPEFAEALSKNRTALYTSSAALVSPSPQPVAEAVAQPYAHEFGKSNGDGTYCVVIERGPFEYAKRFAVSDWPITPLFTSPQPERLGARERSAALDCLRHLDDEIKRVPAKPDPVTLNNLTYWAAQLRSSLQPKA